MTDDALPPAPEPASEPAFNVPLIALVIPVIIIGLAFLSASSSAMRAVFIDGFGLNPILVRAGHWDLLLSYALVHGSLMAAFINALFILIFGTSLARAVGKTLLGAFSFFLFFEVCSVATALAFCWVHAHDNITVVGASGAMSGLLGAAMRLPMIGGKEREVSSLLSSRVISMTVLVVAWNAYNAYAYADQPITMSWESHLSAYFIGLILIEPWLKAFHPQFFTRS